MPHQTPPDIAQLPPAVAQLRRAAQAIYGPAWEQRDIEQALKLLADLVEPMNTMVARAHSHMFHLNLVAPDGSNSFGMLSGMLHEAIEQMGTAMLNMAAVSEVLHQQWTDSLHKPLLASDERK